MAIEAQLSCMPGVLVNSKPQASSVAPVVTTSSTSSKCDGGIDSFGLRTKVWA